MDRRWLREPGFTLIELLVVIAVIAIIAAILFPVFAQVRERARQVACLSNTTQISKAQMMYAQDYDDMIVPWVIGEWSPNNPGLARLQKVWTDLLQPYLKNRQVYFCPSYSEDRLWRAAGTPECWGVTPKEAQGFLESLGRRDYESHYGIGLPSFAGSCTAEHPRVAIAGSGASYLHGAFTGFRWMNLAEVARPADTSNISEGFTLRAGPDALIYIVHGCEGVARHFNGQNLVFLDGHAKHITGNPERTPTFDCGPATIGSTSYPRCACARYLTYDR